MLVISQDRTWILNIENIVAITIEGHAICAKDLSGEIWEIGSYKNEKRCADVLESICGYYGAASIFKMPEA